jgi:adenylyl-sulfate kinase
MNNQDIIPHKHNISQLDRTSIKGHQPAVIWFTGLSGSGKSTIANALEEKLNRDYHVHTYLLDGDNIRKGLNSGLGFSEIDRIENIRRIGEVAKLMIDAGLIVITAFISPYINDREKVRNLLPINTFIEIFIDCPIEICEKRDPKGLYQKARDGKIPDFTGINSPYEKPENPELTLQSDQMSVQHCVQKIIEFLMDHEFLNNNL